MKLEQIIDSRIAEWEIDAGRLPIGSPQAFSISKAIRHLQEIREAVVRDQGKPDPSPAPLPPIGPNDVPKPACGSKMCMANYREVKRRLKPTKRRSS